MLNFAVACFCATFQQLQQQQQQQLGDINLLDKTSSTTSFGNKTAPIYICNNLPKLSVLK